MDEFDDLLRDFRPAPRYAGWWVVIPTAISIVLGVCALLYAIASHADVRECARRCGVREHFLDVSGRCLCATVAP